MATPNAPDSSVYDGEFDDALELMPRDRMMKIEARRNRGREDDMDRALGPLLTKEQFEHARALAEALAKTTPEPTVSHQAAA